MIFAIDERKSIMTGYSTLDMLDMALGSNSAAKWLAILINDINKFAGSKSMDEGQAESLAYLLAQEYKDVKFSVIQLFFYRFKCGYFGRFYGSVDPMAIACALREFIADCERKRHQYESEEYNRRKAEEAARRQETYKRWYECLSELCSSSPDEDGKILFKAVGFHSYVEDRNALIVKLSRDDYDKIQGRYLDFFKTVINKYYPSAELFCSICRTGLR